MRQAVLPYFFSEWVEEYPGIEYAVGGAIQGIDEDVPRLQRVNALRIDLFQEGISFRTTLPGGDWSTRGATIGEFMASTSCVAAINANFSWYKHADVSGDDFVLMGLAITTVEEDDGKRKQVVVCNPGLPPASGNTDEPDVPGPKYAGCVALLIAPDNDAQITEVTARAPVDLGRWAVAIAGSPNPVRAHRRPDENPDLPPLLYTGADEGASPYALLDGHIKWGQGPYAQPPVAARTMVGLSKSVAYGGRQRPRYLFLMTIDGMEGMVPAFGATFYDAGHWLSAAGAHTGFCLDGGGSTAMALRRGDQVTLVNTPFGDERTPGLQRAVGLFFGVRRDF